MENFPQELKSKLNKIFNPKKIELIDKSYLHTKHKSFDPKKLHLKIIIFSSKLKAMQRTDAHKLIFSYLKEEMKNKIHALEIEIK
tara:strand:- start:299 stop:553 length:255 start_codon:yes stop_codon:yes gene_type:complete